MIKAIIIDDEERARRVLTNLLTEFVEGVEVLTTCSNLPDGIKEINKLNPDVVFLDIEMPDYSGLEIIDFFQEIDFEIIFATGYSEFAIQAFEMSAVDYLLKPIQIEKLESAINKANTRIKQKTVNSRLGTLKENLKHKSIERIALPISDGLLFMDVKNITLLEADGSYTKVWTKDGSTILVSKNLKQFEQILTYNENFFKVHRSNIINVNAIEKYSKKESYILLKDGRTVPISRERKIVFEEFVKNIRL